MGGRGENGRDEDKVNPQLLGLPALALVVDGRTMDAAPRPRAALMMSIRPKAARFPRISAQQQDVAIAPRRRAHRSKQRLPVLRRQMIMPEDDSGAPGKCDDGGDQCVAHPFIGHQPQPWQGRGVALAHRPSYSGAMIDDAKMRLDAVQARIGHAAGLANRRPEDVTLIAVSKTHDAAAIRPLLDAGHRVFGENRVQEAQTKWPGLAADFPDISLHLVGQLQSNKAEDAVALFDVIHSVDRTSLVAALSRAQDRVGRRPRCFVQVNIGDEAQKGGCAVADLPALLGDARDAGLDVVGLMAVPPAEVEAAPYFALLAKLAHDHALVGLSMGMTADFETAVMLGATTVRIGSALFGGRS